MRNVKSAAITIVILAILAGCGPMPETTPTAPATLPTVEQGGEAATPPSSTPAASPLTFGDLADRVGAAWQGVQSYRVTFTGTALTDSAGAGTPVARTVATPGATPVARSRDTYTTIREVALPDRQRQTVTGLGAEDHEAIAIGNELYVRGPVLEQIAPDAAAGDWVKLDPTNLPEGALLLHLLGGLPDVPPAPLATLPERLRSQDTRELDSIEHDGRKCRVFAAADTVPETGMRVDYTIAIDQNDIPCFIETGAGGVTQGRDEYSDIGSSFDIEPPAAATPVSIPPALATPIAHD